MILFLLLEGKKNVFLKEVFRSVKGALFVDDEDGYLELEIAKISSSSDKKKFS